MHCLRINARPAPRRCSITDKHDPPAGLDNTQIRRRAHGGRHAVVRGQAGEEELFDAAVVQGGPKI